MNTDDPSYVLRIDKMTGKTVWRVERPTDAIVESPDSYTTPALLRRGADTQIVITGGDVVTGHDSASGKEVWRADVLNPENRDNYRIISSPVIAGELIIAPESHQSSRRPASWRCGRHLEDARGVDVPSRARRAVARQRRDAISIWSANREWCTASSWPPANWSTVRTESRTISTVRHPCSRTARSTSRVNPPASQRSFEPGRSSRSWRRIRSTIRAPLTAWPPSLFRRGNSSSRRMHTSGWWVSGGNSVERPGARRASRAATSMQRWSLP